MKKILLTLLVVMLIVITAVGTVACKSSKGTIVVGVTDYEPMDYQDENGNWIGFDADMAREVFGNLGYTVVFKEIEWEQKYVELDAGTIDCIWNGFTAQGKDEINGQEILRTELVDFSYNYMNNQQCIVVKSDIASSITSEAALAGKIGVAEDGSAGFSYADGLKEDGKIAQAKGVTSQRAALLEVVTGASDFAVVDVLMANSMVGKGDFAVLAKASIELEGEVYAIGFKKGSALTAEVNAELIKLAESGKTQEIAKKYKLENSVITDYSSQK